MKRTAKEMADLLCAELGRPYKQCLDEAASVGETFRSFAEKKHSCCEMLPSDVTDMVVVKREPLGSSCVYYTFQLSYWPLCV